VEEVGEGERAVEGRGGRGGGERGRGREKRGREKYLLITKAILAYQAAAAVMIPSHPPALVALS
jgi:hypothetical protein